MIKSLAMLADPEGYRSRLAETTAEKEQWSALYPVFYYNSCLFPGNRLSLHLFEPRYKVMMQRIVNTTRAFAYVPAPNSYPSLIGAVAMLAELKDVQFLTGAHKYSTSTAPIKDIYRPYFAAIYTYVPI